MNNVGCYPPAEDYHPERMSEKRHQEKVESGAIFDFQKELSAYLKSDVQLLSQPLEALGKEMIELTGINPITECVTIASTAFKVWQKMFLERDLIALEPRNGWRQNQQNQSVVALPWLEFENSKIGGEIQVSVYNFKLQCFSTLKKLSCSKSLHFLNLSCSVLPHF